jgi:hypothetical protein
VAAGRVYEPYAHLRRAAVLVWGRGVARDEADGSWAATARSVSATCSRRPPATSDGIDAHSPEPLAHSVATDPNLHELRHAGQIGCGVAAD